MQTLSPKQQLWDRQMNLWRVKNLLPPVQLPAPTAMDITYSRAYLRGIPEQLKRQEKQKAIQWLCQSVITVVAEAAKNGMTSHRIWEDTYRNKITASLTDEEIIDALKEKFPDCDISLKEIGGKIILIDWS
jgi:hypothetical protein